MSALHWRVAVKPCAGGKVIYYPFGPRETAERLQEALATYYGADAESVELEPMP